MSVVGKEPGRLSFPPEGQGGGFSLFSFLAVSVSSISSGSPTTDFNASMDSTSATMVRVELARLVIERKAGSSSAKKTSSNSLCRQVGNDVVGKVAIFTINGWSVVEDSRSSTLSGIEEPAIARSVTRSMSNPPRTLAQRSTWPPTTTRLRHLLLSPELVASSHTHARKLEGMATPTPGCSRLTHACKLEENDHLHRYCAEREMYVL